MATSAAILIEVARADEGDGYEIRLRINNGLYGYDGWADLTGDPRPFDWCVGQALRMRETMLAAFPGAEVGLVAVYGSTVKVVPR